MNSWKSTELSAWAPPFSRFIIGTGTIAQSHATALKDYPGGEIVSVFDVLGDRADAYASKWGIPNVARSLDDLLALMAREGFNPYRVQEEYWAPGYLAGRPYAAPRRLQGDVADGTSLVFSRVAADARRPSG